MTPDDFFQRAKAQLRNMVALAVSLYGNVKQYLFRRSEPKLCRHCFSELDARATVCPKCRVHQIRFIGIWLTYIPGVLMLVALVSVSIAVRQLGEARQKRIEAENALKRAEQAEKKAEEVEARTRQLANQAEFTSIAIEALNHSRPAFDKLSAIATDANNLFSSQAKAEIDKIISRLGKNNIGTELSTWRVGIELSAITFEEAEKHFQVAPNIDRLQWIGFIGGNNRGDDRGFFARRRLHFLAKIICEDDSLQNVQYAEYLFKLVAESRDLENVPLFSCEFYRKWLETHDTNYPDHK
jgi:ribosomal protein L40E